jgi:O-acetylhomoserine (thiol)-lyase
MEGLRVFGAALSPTSAWQILQGVETLPLRMERHCANALAVARYLQDDPRVGWVNHPGLPDHPQHDLMKQQMRGASRLLAFGVRPRDAAGVPPDMVRISVGLEHIDDILWDIDQALDRAVT